MPAQDAALIAELANEPGALMGAQPDREAGCARVAVVAGNQHHRALKPDLILLTGMGRGLRVGGLALIANHVIGPSGLLRCVIVALVGGGLRHLSPGAV